MSSLEGEKEAGCKGNVALASTMQPHPGPELYTPTESSGGAGGQGRWGRRGGVGRRRQSRPVLGGASGEKMGRAKQECGQIPSTYMRLNLTRLLTLSPLSSRVFVSLIQPLRLGTRIDRVEISDAFAHAADGVVSFHGMSLCTFVVVNCHVKFASVEGAHRHGSVWRMGFAC
jgi:hypothetical protein